MSTTIAKKFSLKDELFNETKVSQIALEIKRAHGSFDTDKFCYDTVSKFANLELKERITHIANMLSLHLPSEYTKAIAIILDALPPELDNNLSDDDFGEFIYASYGEFVALYGCSKEYLQLSLSALKEITRRFSMEYATRVFINEFPDETMQMLLECSLSQSYHQRRLSSESTRPKLPWGCKINLEQTKSIAILDNLYCDKTRFVTRSVANHLNDISKIDSNLVLKTLQRWQGSALCSQTEMEFITNHSLRTLIKQGDKETLEFLGYSCDPSIELADLALHKTEIKVPDVVEFSFTIRAKKRQKLIIDYILHYQTKRGKLTPKVHKLKKLELKSGEKINITKKHPLKANMSTRKLYCGEHKIELQINSKTYGLQSFNITI